MFEALAHLLPKFASLPDVLKELVHEGSCRANAGKLLEMLLDPVKSRMLKVESAACVEGLEPFVKFCCSAEGDSELAFKVGKETEQLVLIHKPSGADEDEFNLPKMPSCLRLCREAVECVNFTEAVQQPEVNLSKPICTVNEILHNVETRPQRPQRESAEAGVCNAALAGETERQRMQREAQEGSCSCSGSRATREGA